MNFPDKLKKSQKEILEGLIEYNFDKFLVIDTDILNTICKISQTTGYEVSLLIDRKGHIVDVSCGDKNSATHSIEAVDCNGYCGLRLIHTHPNASSTLSQMDLSFLKKHILKICFNLTVIFLYKTNSNGIWTSMDPNGCTNLAKFYVVTF